ncbi:hypothetical protein AAFF_G00285930 [Aldrovandia affinis]|uniref:Perilipin n=1 Tax=Aldrovandia affinis TaxID=143900 RepID=A0AAD7TBY8_9TELE|nr:hypothetical protein AAFF_G00285930 [Aldrovandia affinis]
MSGLACSALLHLTVHVTTMALEKTAPPSVQEGKPQDIVFLRLLNLPVVSSTYEMIERTYTSTKHTHPLLCSVCGVYERGAKTAGSLAVWSVQPALHRLEPQLEAVNNLACRGLDRLEEKIPALQYPPEKLASDITEAFTSTLLSAKQGLTAAIASTSDTVLGLATGGYQLTRSAVSGGVDYVLSSGPVHLAGEGADTALTLTEHLVNYILPASDREIKKDGSWEQDAGAESPDTLPGYHRLGTLASTVCRRAYDQTAAQLQRTRGQGRELVMSIPGVTPLVGVAKRNLEMAGGVVLGLQSSMGGIFGGMDEQMDKENRKKREGEQLRVESSSGGVRGLVSGLGQQLQSAYVSVVSGVKNAPSATVGLARDGTGALLETLGSARERVLETAYHYGLLPGPAPQGRPDASCSTIEEEEENVPSGAGGKDQRPAPLPGPQGDESGPPQISDEARVLQQKVLEQIPIQQRILLGGPRPAFATVLRGEVTMSHACGVSGGFLCLGCYAVRGRRHKDAGKWNAAHPEQVGSLRP